MQTLEKLISGILLPICQILSDTPWEKYSKGSQIKCGQNPFIGLVKEGLVTEVIHLSKKKTLVLDIFFHGEHFGIPAKVNRDALESLCYFACGTSYVALLTEDTVKNVVPKMLNSKKNRTFPEIAQ